MHESLHLPLIHELYELVKEVLACFSRATAFVGMSNSAIDLFLFLVNTVFIGCPLDRACAVLHCSHGARVAKGFMMFSIGECVWLFFICYRLAYNAQCISCIRSLDNVEW